MGEAAEAGSGVSSLLVCDEAEPPDSAVYVEDPGELSEAAYAFQSHDEEGSEGAEWVSGWSSRSGCVVAAE